MPHGRRSASTGRWRSSRAATAVWAARWRSVSRGPAPTSWSRAGTRTPARSSQQRCGTSSACGRSASGVHVGRWDTLDGFVERVYGEMGSVDVLVNNAGMSPLYDSVDSVSEELFDKVLAVNLKGPFRLSALDRHPDGRRWRWLDHQHLQRRCRAPAAEHPPVCGGQGRSQRPHRGAGAHLRTVGAGERDHGRHVPHRRQQGVGHGGVRRAGARGSRWGGAASRTRSSARRSTSPATCPATRPARSSPSTAANPDRFTRTGTPASTTQTCLTSRRRSADTPATSQTCPSSGGRRGRVSSRLPRGLDCQSSGLWARAGRRGSERRPARQPRSSRRTSSVCSPTLGTPS